MESTAVALATTSEFVALVPAAMRRGIPELAVAGIIGSVIYNAAVTLGATAVLRPLTVDGVVGPAGAVTLLSIVLAVVARTRGRLDRPLAACLLVGYLAFLGFVLR